MIFLTKLFELLGKDVLSQTNGKTIGVIHDIAIQKSSLLKIEAYIVKCNNHFNETLNFIPWHQLRLGQDISLMDNSKELQKVNVNFRLQHYLFREDLMDLRVFTNDGLEVGLLKDVFLSEDEGTIDCLQCSDGLINDILNGRSIYPLIGKLNVTKESILIHKDCIEEALAIRKK